MKKYLGFIVVMLVLLLTACSKDDDRTGTAFTRQLLKNFSVDIPETWRRVNPENFANTIPEGTAALFVQKDATSDFIQNVNIILESLNTNASSLEYAKANTVLATKTIAEYKLISQAEIEIHGIKTSLHVFQARNTPVEPLRQYFQAYFVQDRIGYTITCVAKNDDAVQQQTCEAVLKSFRLL